MAYKNQRGVLLISTDYKKVLRVASKTFLNNITHLFKRYTVYKGVLYLNDEILLRNQANVRAKNIRRGLCTKDAQNTITKFKSKDKSKHLSLIVEELYKINLIISASSLLVPRNYINKLFLLFSDKEDSMPLVTILSTRETRQITSRTTTQDLKPNIVKSLPLTLVTWKVTRFKKRKDRPIYSYLSS